MKIQYIFLACFFMTHAANNALQFEPGSLANHLFSYFSFDVAPKLNYNPDGIFYSPYGCYKSVFILSMVCVVAEIISTIFAGKILGGLLLLLCSPVAIVFHYYFLMLSLDMVLLFYVLPVYYIKFGIKCCFSN